MLQLGLPQEPVRRRPHYQTIADLVAEEEIAQLAATCWRCDQSKLDEGRFTADRVFSWRNRDLLVAEVKDRKWQHGAGDGLYLSQAKVNGGLADAHQLGCLPALIVRLAAGDIWVAALDAYQRGRVVRWGRTDRAEPADMEPSLVFPWPAFTRLA